MSLSDCIKLCQLIRCQLPETSRLQRECGTIAVTASSIGRALTAQAKTSNAAHPDVGASYQKLYIALEEAAGVIGDCCKCGAVRGLLITRSLHQRAVEAARHLAEAQYELPWATAEQVAAGHTVPGAVVATVAAGEDAAMQRRAASFEQLVLTAEKIGAERKKVLQEVVALLQQPSQALPTASRHISTGTPARLAQHPAFGDLPIPLLEAEMADLRLPRIGGDKHVLRMQLVVASIIEEHLFQLDVAPKDLRCPLTHRLFKQPVVLVESGLVYERAAIEEWLTQGNMNDPVTGAGLTSGAVVPNVLLRQLAEEWAVRHARKKRRQQQQQQRKRQRERRRRQQQQHSELASRQQPAGLELLLEQQELPEAVLAAELAAHCGYVYIRQLPDQSMFGANRALLVRCNRTNRLRTLLQIPRAQLQQLDRHQQQELVRSLECASDLHHPHTLQVQEVFLGPLHLHIVLEECSAGRLVDFPAQQHSMWGAAGPGGAAAALSPDFARWFFQQVVLAVDYYHTKGLAGLAVEGAVLKVVPGVPQPVVKVPTPLLAHGLVALCSEAQPAAHSTADQPAGHQASAASGAKTDLFACGVLLVKLLGLDLQQQHDWQQQLEQQQQQTALTKQQLQHQQPLEQRKLSMKQQAASLTALLHGLLHRDPEKRYTVADVKANAWFQQQLPPAAEGMAARFITKGRACKQSVEGIAAVAEVASSVDNLLLMLHSTHQQQQQQQVMRGGGEQQVPQQQAGDASKLRGQPLASAGAAGSTWLQHAIQLQLHALFQSAAELAVLCSSPGLQLLPAAAVALVLLKLVEHVCGRMAAAWLLVQQQQQQQQGTMPLLLLLLLQQSCSSVLLSARLLLGILKALQQQPVEQRQQSQVQYVGSLHTIITLHSQLLHGVWQLLPSACTAVAVANTTINLGRRSKLALQRLWLPLLPQSAPAVSTRGQLLATQQALIGAVLLPLVNMPNNPLFAASMQDVAMLPARLPTSVQQSALGAAVLWQSLAVVWQLLQQQQGRTRLPVALQVSQSAQELPASLQLLVKQPQPVMHLGGLITLDGLEGEQQAHVVGLASLWGPSKQHMASSVSESRPAECDQLGNQLVPAAHHPDLSLVSAACAPEASAQLATTLQQLLHADVSSGSGQVLAPITQMCLDPPLLVMPQPPSGTLEQWLRTAAGKVRGTQDDFTAAWVASLPWSKVLQVLIDVAAALSLLHQQQPPVVHGGVHAAAINLLQQLAGEDGTQQLQQQVAAQSSGQVCQLSLVGLLSQLAPIRSCHPFLAAPEVVLAAGPATAAADVYGFGVLMFQLATGWLPQQYTPGTDEQISAVLWCRDMLAQVGSTSPLAAAQQRLQQQQQQHSWTPYDGYMPSRTALEQLPAGYVALMEDCLQRVPPVRPVVQEVLARLQNIAGGTHPPSLRPSLLLQAAAVQLEVVGQEAAVTAGAEVLLPISSKAGHRAEQTLDVHSRSSGQARPPQVLQAPAPQAVLAPRKLPPSPGYMGVVQSRSLMGVWKAQILFHNKAIDLGTYDSADEAARVWNEAALLLLDHRVQLNPVEPKVRPGHKVGELHLASQVAAEDIKEAAAAAGVSGDILRGIQYTAVQ